MSSLLVGYIRKANSGANLKVSINVQAFKDCEIYTTSDGQQYVSLVMSLSAVNRVIGGERAVSTLSQIIEDDEE
tara:strand:- start:749 stop:970 length:222 start_codon:yes stop_codon:yes gene_type:complete